MHTGHLLCWVALFFITVFHYGILSDKEEIFEEIESESQKALVFPQKASCDAFRPSVEIHQCCPSETPLQGSLLRRCHQSGKDCNGGLTADLEVPQLWTVDQELFQFLWPLWPSLFGSETETKAIPAEKSELGEYQLGRQLVDTKVSLSVTTHSKTESRCCHSAQQCSERQGKRERQTREEQRERQGQGQDDRRHSSLVCPSARWSCAILGIHSAAASANIAPGSLQPHECLEERGGLTLASYPELAAVHSEESCGTEHQRHAFGSETFGRCSEGVPADELPEFNCTSIGKTTFRAWSTVGTSGSRSSTKKIRG